MIVKNLFPVLLLLQVKGTLSYKTCNDCVEYDICPATANISWNSKDKQKIEQSICGPYKVCCTDFTPRDSMEVTPPTLSNMDECGINMEDKIIAGIFAEQYEFPWMALLSIDINRGQIDFACSGSIIDSRHILTAAHCFNKGRLIGVRVGENSITTCGQIRNGESCEHEDFYYEKIIKYEEENAIVQWHDIALIRLMGTISFVRDSVLPICLPFDESIQKQSLIAETLTAAGWGTADWGGRPRDLRKTTLNIINNTSCERAHPQNQLVHIICAQGGKGKQDTCEGDSGGPLMLKQIVNGQIRYFQYGIVAVGSKDCLGSPSMYTDVRKYKDWILKNINV